MSLTEEQIYQNKIKYIELLTKLNIDLTDLTQYFEAIDYFTKPLASSGPKDYPGSLCEHALNVYYELCQLVNAYVPGRYTELDVIKVALFKDMYRAELYEGYLKNVKDEASNNWVSVPAWRYSETRPTFGDLGFNAYMIAKHFVEFTDEQVEAITQWATKENYGGDIHEIFKSFPLLTLTKMADLAATYLVDVLQQPASEE